MGMSLIYEQSIKYMSGGTGYMRIIFRQADVRAVLVLAKRHRR